MRSLSGKVALVTGGNSGIGFATAKVLASYGAKVAITGTRTDATEMAAEKLKKEGFDALPVFLNLYEPSSIKAAIDSVLDAFGRIDILHNNAADLSLTHHDGDVENTEIEIWEKVFKADLHGTMLCCKYVLPHMVQQGGGAIVNTASALGVNAAPAQAAYGAAKAAVISLTRSIATSHGKRGIRCNAVVPGMTRTQGAMDNLPAFFMEMQLAENLTPYIAEPEDIGQIVAFLASDEARYLTGQAIMADGGSSVHIAGFATMNQKMAE
jgi:NAD(P)-dependent dehydrogenase (short-subunit alcohol dehydrogenase family)